MNATEGLDEVTVIDRDEATGATLVYCHGLGWRASTWPEGQYTDLRSRAEVEFEGRVGRISRQRGPLSDTAGFSSALSAARALRPDVPDTLWSLIAAQPVTCVHVPTGLDLANRVEALRAGARGCL